MKKLALAIALSSSLILLGCQTNQARTEQYHQALLRATNGYIQQGKCAEARREAGRATDEGYRSNLFAIVYADCYKDMDEAFKYLTLGARYGSPFSRRKLAEHNKPIPAPDLVTAAPSAQSSSDDSASMEVLSIFFGAMGQGYAARNSRDRPVTQEILRSQATSSIQAVPDYPNATSQATPNKSPTGWGEISEQQRAMRNQGPAYGQTDSHSSSVGGCSSDIACGLGRVCVKRPYSSTGTCMTAVDQSGARTYQSPSSNYGINGPGSCAFNSDCPSGFRCDQSYKACIKN